MPPTLPTASQHAGADQIGCSDEEGRQYREGVYRPLDSATLADAPDGPPFPERGHGPPFHLHNEIPRVPRLRHLIGPSVIALGMGLGAGEFLLWPNLITVNGYSIWWLFWVGVITQFVVISEIERWTIATGESVFAGMGRLDRWGIWPWFFLVATLAGFFWPGWASQSAEFTAWILEEATGVRLAWQPLAIFMILICYVGLAVSKIVYNALERFQIGLVLAFFPLLAVSLLAIGILPADMLDLLKGAASIGSAPPALISGAQFPTLLIAVAYAGSGGTLLLAQSLWLRDKGFGMAAYQGRIAGIRGENEEISEAGYVFDPHRAPTMLARFRHWIRVSEHELLITFVALIILSVVITTMLVTATLGRGNAELAGNLTGMVRMQADRLEEAVGLWLKIAFLLGGAFVLFSTQLGIVDTVTRIAGTVFYERYGRRTAFWNIKRTFLLFLTIMVGASIAIVVASWVGGTAVERLQPNFLVLIAGPFTISSMYAFAIVVGYINVRRLPAELAMPMWKRIGMIWAAVLWGWFTAEQLSRVMLGLMGAPAELIGSITMHPVRIVMYGGWIISLLWFSWVMLRPSPRAVASHAAKVAAVILALVVAPIASAGAQGPAALVGIGTPPARTPVVAFVNVNVIPMDRERVLEGQTVLVRDGRIAQVGPSASVQVPQGAVRVEGRGKYLIPGLAEMHGHLPGQMGPAAEATLFLYLSNGITFVRGMQGAPGQLEMKRGIERGELLGPTLYLAGPQLSGQSVPSVADAERVVSQQKQAGFDLLKIQEGLAPDVYEAVAASAKRHDITFGGHVPNGVGARGAMAAGQKTIDHLDNLVEDLVLMADGAIPSGAELGRRIGAAAGEVKRAGVAVVPTMPLWEMILVGGDSVELARRTELQYVSPQARANWFQQARTRSQAPGAERNRQIIDIRNRLLDALSDSGVVILLGTDAPQIMSVPGFSIQREMQTMARAGMSPWQILVSGTRAVAEHLGTPTEFGTIQPGRRADLILLDANPLQDIGNAARRSGVMARGLWMPESEIQARLARVAAAYRAQ